MITCCKECTERHVGCHAECESYIWEKEEADKKRQAIIKARTAEKDIMVLAMTRGQRRVRHKV